MLEAEHSAQVTTGSYPIFYIKPAEKIFRTLRRPCIPHKQWFDIIQELMIHYCTKVESSLLQIDPTLWWNFSQTILNFFFWHILFWLVLFLVVSFVLVFFFASFFASFFCIFFWRLSLLLFLRLFSHLFHLSFQGLAIHSWGIPRD